MILQELIAWLEPLDPAIVFPIGFGRPHSYRGTYSELAFEPLENVTVAAMLQDARMSLGRTFVGWKGGEFTMDRFSEVYLARWGESGEGIGPVLLGLMLWRAGGDARGKEHHE